MSKKITMLWKAINHAYSERKQRIIIVENKKVAEIRKLNFMYGHG